MDLFTDFHFCTYFSASGSDLPTFIFCRNFQPNVGDLSRREGRRLSCLPN